MNREDKRVQRTREALSAALVDLSLEQGYDAVTIQEIAARAAVSYRTYFRHYPDKDTLLREVLQATVLELRQLMGPPAAPDRDEPFRQFLTAENGRALFLHIQDGSDLYRVLLDSGPVVLDPIVVYAEQEVVDALGPALEGPLPAAIVANFLVSTTIDLVRWWLDNDMPYNAEEMGRYLALLTTLPPASASQPTDH